MAPWVGLPDEQAITARVGLFRARERFARRVSFRLGLGAGVFGVIAAAIALRALGVS
jgi:hypothetical protein